MRGNRPCPIFRRWSGSSSIISSRRPPGSPPRRPSSGASPGIRPRRSAISGSTSSGSTSICLLPLSLVFSLFLMSQGIVQNFKPYVRRGRRERRPATRTRPRRPDHRPGPGGLASRHQDARDERRRLFQRQRRPSLRESDAPLELPPDALHLPHPERPDLLPRAEGQEPEARLGRLERHGHPLSGRGARLLAGRKRRQSPPAGPRRRPGRRQHGRKGGPVRHFRFQPVRHRHDGGLLRRGQFHARFLHAAGRAGPARSTSSSARSSSAASAPGFTGCSSSSSWPSSSPA